MTSQQKMILAIIVLGSIGGSIATFVKLGVQVVPPFTFTFLRFLVASLCMLPFLYKEIQNYSWRTLLSAVGVSLLAVGNVVIFAFGVRHTTAVISSLMYVTAPVMIALLSYFLLQEHFSRRKITGILVGTLGVLFLILLPVFTRGIQFSGTLLGNITVLAAVICFALYTVFSKHYQKTISARIMSFIFTASASIVLLPFAIADWFVSPGWIYQVNWLTILAIGYVGILGGAVFYLLYQKTIQRGSPVIASMNMFIQPISAYATGLIFLGEKLIFGVVLGAIASVIGAWIVTTEKKMKKVGHA